MNVLVTGGAGFIGRWIGKYLVADGHFVWILDDFSNGHENNIAEFISHPRLKAVIRGDVKDSQLIRSLFNNNFDVCLHLAADVNVQNSINDPWSTFQIDTLGTLSVLEASRETKTKFVLVSTCMVYDASNCNGGIKETSALLPKSPYAASKLASENLAISYFHSYGLPTVIVRPFNTYGPFQKSTAEGGVVSIFIKNSLNGGEIRVYGDGNQTRDFLYVEDCAKFILRASFSSEAIGEIIHAGTGHDITIIDLAKLISNNSETKITLVPHIHPQCEIYKLACDRQKAKNLLGWEPEISLSDGISRTRQWIMSSMEGK